jgi:hypothetical protein
MPANNCPTLHVQFITKCHTPTWPTSSSTHSAAHQVLNATQFCHCRNNKNTISMSVPHAVRGCVLPLHERKFTIFSVRKTSPNPLPNASLNALKYHESIAITATTLAIQHENLAAKSKETKSTAPSLLSEYSRRSSRLLGMPNLCLKSRLCHWNTLAQSLLDVLKYLYIPCNRCKHPVD